MKNSNLMILGGLTVLVGGLALATPTFAQEVQNTDTPAGGYRQMHQRMGTQGENGQRPEKLSKEDHEAMKTSIQAALEANDYNAFVAAHPEAMRTKVTQAMFDEAKKQYETMKPLKAFHDKYANLKDQVDKGAARAAMEANDYNAFVAAHPEAMRADLTQELFELMKNNKPMKGEKMGEWKDKKNEMKEERMQKNEAKKLNKQAILSAIQANDYNAFVASLPEQLQDVITPEIFTKIVERFSQKATQ